MQRTAQNGTRVTVHAVQYHILSVINPAVSQTCISGH